MLFISRNNVMVHAHRFWDGYMYIYIYQVPLVEKKVYIGLLTLININDRPTVGKLE